MPSLQVYPGPLYLVLLGCRGAAVDAAPLCSIWCRLQPVLLPNIAPHCAAPPPLLAVCCSSQLCSANSTYEGVYLLGTSIARPLIAKRQIEIAMEVGGSRVAVGC